MKIFFLVLGITVLMALISIIVINAPQPTLTIDAKEMPLPRLLDTMKETFNLNWYPEADSVTQHMLPVTYKANRATMKQMLTALERLEPGLTFQVRNIGYYQDLLIKVKTPGTTK